MNIKNISKKITLLVMGSLCFQIAYGMSGEQQFMPTGEPARVPLPYLRELQESVGRHQEVSSSSFTAETGGENKRETDLVSAQATRRRFSDQEIQELLKNKMTIPLHQFTEENLIVRQRWPGLNSVGFLLIEPTSGVQIPANLVELIRKYFPHVLRLTMNDVGLGNAGFKALAQNTIASQLIMLQVYSCGITSQEFTSENLNKFESLDALLVSQNQIGDVGFRALAQSRIAAQLKVFLVDQCGITAQSFALENFNKLKNLRELGIGYNQLEDAGFKALAKSNFAPQLKKLLANRCGISPESFIKENLDRFESLEYLCITSDMLSQSYIIIVLAHSDISKTLKTIYYGLSGEAVILFGNACRIEKR